MRKRLLIILGALFVAGIAIAGILYVAFPIAMTTYGGMSLNYLKTLSTPAGTVSTEANPAYTAARDCRAVESRGRPGMAERGGWGLAQLQQNAVIAAVLAAHTDQHQECGSVEGFVHLRHPSAHLL